MRLLSKGPDETEDIGFRLGRLLRSGDVVALYGELGSGKTTMVKGIANTLGIEEREIVSASFTMIVEYSTTPPLFHIDLYRIEKDAELDEIGLRNYIGGEGISVIEWAEKAERELPEDAIRVELKSVGENMREIAIEGVNEKNWNNL